LAGCTIKGAGLFTTSQSADSSTTEKSAKTCRLTHLNHIIRKPCAILHTQGLDEKSADLHAKKGLPASRQATLWDLM
jgi:hypothetical protein